jgi:hypothetical protein
LFYFLKVLNTEDFDQQFFIGLLRSKKYLLFPSSGDEKENWEWVTGESLAVKINLFFNNLFSL